MIVGVLYWAQAVFLPLALAILVAFALAPVAGWLERMHLGRVLSALLSTGAVISLIVGVFMVAERQAERLVIDLRGDTYQENINRKVNPLLELVHRLDRMEESVSPEPPPKPAGEASKPTDPPVPVFIKQSGPGVLSWLPSLARPVAEVATTLLLVTVLTVFMLVQRKTTRDRLIGLAHRRQLTMTTRALDAAALRVRRFLLLQAATNIVMGVIVGVGLSLIGVPFAALCGLLTAVLRFLPYVGIWLSSLFPILLALAVFPGWGPALLVLALYGGFDLVMSNGVEPLLFGHGTGVSSLALLMAAVFWAFLWGPVGLLVAVPLTVCLVVLGEYIPSLEFLRVLLGDTPEVDPGALFYFRALAGDSDGAAVLVDEQPGATLVDVYERVLLPALAQAKAEKARGGLDVEEERAVYRVVRTVITDVLATRHRAKTSVGVGGPIVIGCAAHGAADRVALRMFGDLVAESGGELVAVPAAKLVAEVERRRAADRPISACIVTVAPGGLGRAAKICHEVRSGVTGVRVIVSRWGAEPDVTSAEKLLRSSGAGVVTWNLVESLKELVPGNEPPPSPRLQPTRSSPNNLTPINGA
jgi:predicted PurR-regulated permease PerM